MGFSSHAKKAQELSMDLPKYHFHTKDAHVFHVLHYHQFTQENYIISRFSNQQNHCMPNHKITPLILDRLPTGKNI